jgi:hypothetical protein
MRLLLLLAATVPAAAQPADERSASTDAVVAASLAAGDTPCWFELDPEGKAEIFETGWNRETCLWAHGLDVVVSGVRAAHWPATNETALFRGQHVRLPNGEPSLVVPLRRAAPPEPKLSACPALVSAAPVSGRGWSAVPAEPDERPFAPIAAFHRQSADAFAFLGLRAAAADETGAAGPRLQEDRNESEVLTTLSILVDGSEQSVVLRRGERDWTRAFDHLPELNHAGQGHDAAVRAAIRSAALDICGVDSRCYMRYVLYHGAAYDDDHRGAAEYRWRRVARAPPSDLLHVFVTAWTSAHMLPQMLAFWRNRVPGCSLTLIVLCEANVCPEDETYDLAAQFDCSIVEFQTNARRAWRDADAISAGRDARAHLWKHDALVRGAAWVALPDLDELLDIDAATLRRATREGVTVFRTEGFNLFGDSLDYRKATRGAPSRAYSKTLLFRPAHVDGIATTAGNHADTARGHLVYNSTRLFHFKYAKRTWPGDAWCEPFPLTFWNMYEWYNVSSEALDARWLRENRSSVPILPATGLAGLECRPEWPCAETDDQLAERRERACATMERIHERQKGHIKAIYGLAPEDDFDAHKARLAREIRPDYTGPFRVDVHRDPSGHVTDTLWVAPRK